MTMHYFRDKLTVFFIMLLLIIAVFSTKAIAAGRAGATIESNARLESDAGSVSSEFTFTTIGQIYGITVEPSSASAYDMAGVTHYFPHSITNVGNGSDHIIFDLSGPVIAPWTFSLIKDDNGNGIHDEGEDVPLTDVLLAEDAKIDFFVAIWSPPTEVTGATREAWLRATCEVSDGAPYMGVNGTIYGGYDLTRTTDLLTIESLTSLMIHREDATGRIYLTWNGGNADVYHLDDTYDPSFEGTHKEGTNESSPYTCLSIEANDGKIRYYRIKLSGSSGYVNNTVGKFDVDAKTGFTLTSIPFIFTSEAATSLDAVIGTQLTGGTVPVSSDRIYAYISSPPYGSWKQAYLKTGSGAGWSGTLRNYGPDIGAWVRILEGHSDVKLTYVGIVSEAASREIVLRQGFNLIGTAYPVVVSIEASSLESVLTSGDSPANADRIYSFNNGTWDQSWLKTGEGWKGNVKSLSPGKAYWIKKQGSTGTWFYPKPYVSKYD